MNNKINIVPHRHDVRPQDREQRHGHKGHVAWFTGLSGSGKSTLASSVELVLHESGVRTFVLDGDNVRQGLNSDLGFDDSSREENIRRIAHVSDLMRQAGIVVLCAFVSPFRRDRQFVKDTIGEQFSEIFVSTPLDVCERRDVKGLYAKARSGKIERFTGISAPFETPQNPDLDVPTHEMDLESATKLVVSHITNQIELEHE